ncbi:hypothetical protein SmJEL517_g06120 [Synchytrium microbalum]|uniref:Vacuolar-sorting protein SNF7 n=1 Tax=Synchytrium microbalum TaxID=1806994 RepID=A0A507BRA4_9FUNG|nr:uncharacterized protein SmJEL517_g06120 [Synchytrium microbalum]TPX30292.1 hypothetical protein SmJEL517_g06120 [Synchytrium microbalum]
MALKRKKVYEEQITKIMGSRMTLETQMMSIESANVNLETMEAMRQGAAAMKQVHGKMDIKKVDQVMDDIRDQMDLANEISDAISQPVGYGMEFDDDELNQELDELEQLELDEKLLDTSSPQANINNAPAVPNTIPAIAQPPRPARVQVQDDEDAELAELKASMAL